MSDEAHVEEMLRGAAGRVAKMRGSDGEDLAVRIFPPGEARALDRFSRERGLRKVLGEKEGFVPILGTGVSPEGPYLMMPLMKFPTLRERLRKGPLMEAETLTLAQALAESVGRAHRTGYVHLALRPENIFLDDEGRPLIADLGITKHFPRKRDHLSPYEAPEQLRGSCVVGFEADVYALGTIVAECLAGSPPGPGEGLRALLVRTGRPRVPLTVAFIVDRARGEDPLERFGSGDAVALFLQISAARWRIALIAFAIVVAAVAMCALSAQLFVKLTGVIFAAQLGYYAFVALKGMALQMSAAHSGPVHGAPQPVAAAEPEQAAAKK